LSKLRYLVTGGCGFIGNCLLRKLIPLENVEVLNIDKLTYASTEYIPEDKHLNKYKFKKIDISDEKNVTKAIEEFKPNYIINLAAESHVDRSIDGPKEFINTNIVGTYNLIDKAYTYWKSLPKNEKNNFRFIHISTDEVYGSLDKGDSPFTEESNYLPNSPYSATKASSDHLVRAWNKTYGFPSIITNTCNNYGPHQFPEKLIPLTIGKCIKRESIPVYGNGQQVRDWIRVEDHVDGILQVVNYGKIGEKYNIGSQNELKNINVVKDICKIFNEINTLDEYNYEQLIEFVDDRPGHDIRYAINNDKINTLGWKPYYSWEEGLRETVDWYISKPEYFNVKTKKSYSGERLGKL